MTPKQIAILAPVMLAALFGPTLFMKSGLLGGQAPAEVVETEFAQPEPPRKTTLAKQAYEDSEEDGYSVSTERDERGHFHFDTVMNGSDVPVMVDTGASVVAINMSTADSIGVEVDEESRGVTVNTANGRVKAYPVTIDEIAIGEVVVENVKAVVLGDEALSDTLLGMSFLNKLSGFNIRDGELTLRQ
ncbi:MAG: TIGR02281 family clan AA aspartic protease [Pseudomonadota bacterium]